MSKTTFYLLFLVTLISCDKELVEQTPTGDVTVSVRTTNQRPVSGSRVYTNPPTKESVTDEFGSTLLTDIEVGSYEVFADLENVGSGKSVVNIKEGELSLTNIFIEEGIFAGLGPTVQIILPEVPAEFSFGEEINFSADIKDDETTYNDIKVSWSSDLDGVISTQPVDIKNNSNFTISNLSRGNHVITVSAEDSDGFTSSASIEISTTAPSGVTLLAPTKVDGFVKLDWTEYQNDDFKQYEVYRTNENCTIENQVLLASINEQKEISFIDKTAPFSFQVCYFVKVINNENKSRSSNFEKIDNPSGHIFDFTAFDVLKHPNEKYLYLLDQGGMKMIKFDYQNLEVVNETALQGTIGYCAIGDNGFGVEIYTPSEDGWIYVYDADDFSLVTSINTGLPTSSVVINGLGHVIAAVEPSPWWEQPVRTYKRSNGLHIDGNGGFDRDRLRMIPTKNKIISISTGVSPVDMEYFDLSSAGLINEHVDDQYHGDHPLDPKIFRISTNGEFAITSRHGAVYTANSAMEYRGQLQHGSIEFSDFAFSDDGQTIYAGTSNRKSIQIGKYPSLIREDEILTKGFPIFIEKDGNKIISVSKSDESSILMGVEIIDL